MADCAYIPECDFYHDLLDGMPMTAEINLPVAETTGYL